MRPTAKMKPKTMKPMKTKTTTEPKKYKYEYQYKSKRLANEKKILVYKEILAKQRKVALIRDEITGKASS